MTPDPFVHLWEFLAGIQWLIAMLWLGLALFTIGLAILLYTRWGQYKALRKCMAMSLLAHLLLASYAASVQVTTPIPPPPEQVINVSIGDAATEAAAAEGGAMASPKGSEKPWEVFHNDAVAPPQEAELERGPTDQPAEPKRLVRTAVSKLPGDPVVEHVAVAEAKPVAAAVEAAGRSAPGESPAAIEAPPSQRREAAPPATPEAGTPPERLAGEATPQPPRTTTDDVPVALLQRVEMLPKMSESDANPLAAVADSPTGSVAVTRLSRVERLSTKRTDHRAVTPPTKPAMTRPRSARPKPPGPHPIHPPIGSLRRRLPV